MKRLLLITALFSTFLGCKSKAPEDARPITVTADRAITEDRILLHKDGGPSKTAGVCAVSIQSSPQGAAITVDGKALKETTDADLYAEEGAYQIQLSLQGFQTETGTLDVKDGRTTNKFFRKMQPTTNASTAPAKPSSSKTLH